MTNESARLGILTRGPGDEKERELSWLDYSLVTDISPDGQRILLTESGEGRRCGYRPTCKDGRLSGDPSRRRSHRGVLAGRRVGDLDHGAGGRINPPEILLLPTSVGEPRRPRGRVWIRSMSDFLPDGKQIIYTATQSGQGMRLYILATSAGGKSRALTPEGYSMFRGTITPDGQFGRSVSGPDPPDLPLSAGGVGEPRALPGLDGQPPPGAILGGRQSTSNIQEDQTIPSRINSLRHGDRKLDLVEGADGRRRRRPERDQPFHRDAGREDVRVQLPPLSCRTCSSWTG